MDLVKVQQDVQRRCIGCLFIRKHRAGERNYSELDGGLQQQSSTWKLRDCAPIECKLKKTA